MSIYNGMSGKESNLEQSYILLDLAGQVALRVWPPLWSFEFELTVIFTQIGFCTLFLPGVVHLLIALHV
jgi:hypothetical protein